MKKNNKGFTVVELLLSFIIVSIIVIGMLTIALRYQESTTISEVKLELDNYKNTVTKKIQDNILELGISDVNVNGNGNGNNIVLTFKNNLTKTVVVSNNYIEYDSQRYELPHGEFESIICNNKDLNACNSLGTYFKITIPIYYSDFEDSEQYSINITGNK